MSMDPQVEQLLAGMANAGGPLLDEMTPQQMRAFYATVGEQLGGPGWAMAEVKNLSAPSPVGATPLRLYRPLGLMGGQPRTDLPARC